MIKIGIIGGGQLAWMLCIEAHKRGYQTIVLDPNPNASAFHIATEKIIAQYDNIKAVESLFERSTVVTYEFENVDLAVLTMMEEKYHKLPQGSYPLYLSQNRIREKQAAIEASILVPTYRDIKSKDELIEALNTFKLPAILKTATGGYDGKGQIRIINKDNLPDLVVSQSILEEVIPFSNELSVIAFKNKKGDFTHLPVICNQHVNGILHISSVPAPFNEDIIEEAINSTKRFIDLHNITGILTIEFFLHNGKLYFNEIAPRPHNSGHLSIDAYEKNQYGLLLDSILNLDLAFKKTNRQAVMLNVLGQNIHYLSLYKPDLKYHLYDYKKDQVVYNRKMGHITFLDTNPAYIEQLISELNKEN